MISSPDLLERKVLPVIFKEARFSSFLRKVISSLAFVPFLLFYHGVRSLLTLFFVVIPFLPCSMCEMTVNALGICKEVYTVWDEVFSKSKSINSLEHI